ncbi:TIM-barrel domain-containing protein [Psychrosphaera haliotis]|uniref:DUF5110 domain-containing protein n=1 Tax=Psychrosphaera haliotis TaxID=555083 RepID=A0A6N8FDV8_9GAMM|nr:TIM-barrel domain-containing protein [Psychrosphaera haliotis]MUH72531.1 DUF5110 domain-containing protein [Psychrosphaera haliotis]
MKALFSIAIICLSQLSFASFASFAGSVNEPSKTADKSILFTLDNGNKLKVSAYGDEIIRLHSTVKGQPFYADNHYEMVASHDWRQNLALSSTKTHWQVAPIGNKSLQVLISKNTLKATFLENGVITLAELQSPSKTGTIIKTEFAYQQDEHFTGLGHGFYGREPKLDLKGQRTGRNYGKQPIEQAPLIVPFYLSSKGYGVFLNSTFTNEFSFGDKEEYSVAIDDHGFSGQMDYFYISGGKLANVLDNYTQLTGRPRLPAKSMFGLQLSDKGHDHDSPTPSNETWWKNKILEHREAGYPLDHVINDNRWRAAGGKRCESKLDWDKERYPDPAAYQQWLEKNALVLTLDFNRCIAKKSEGWKASFNLPSIDNIQFPNSAPDLTNAEFRSWFWDVFYKKALVPEKQYPGDALWIDEFDEQGAADKSMILSNGRSSAEMRNYWFFLIAKALVADGWDKSGINKRPFVWVRGMTAGAQRYATLWSGDIYPNYNDMQSQIRGMQLAGLSGFPFWGHDAGGFYDWKNNLGPDETLYQQWSIGFGSFSPIWKPHGMGQSRWPLDRSKASQKAFLTYAQMRYELMPYTYSMAHEASLTGLPIARAMVLDYQEEELAWQYDLQYMWGDSMLVAPQTKSQGKMTLWLPPGQWYQYASNKIVKGDNVVGIEPAADELPLYVKAGAIIPKRQFVKSTGFIDKSRLGIDIYVGADSSFTLVEDDDKTEAYRTKNQKRLTQIYYSQSSRQVKVNAAVGTFSGAQDKRAITLRFFGTNNITSVKVNGKSSLYNISDGILHVELDTHSVKQTILIELN